MLGDEWPETGADQIGQLLGGAGEQRVVVVEQLTPCGSEDARVAQQ